MPLFRKKPTPVVAYQYLRDSAPLPDTVCIKYDTGVLHWQGGRSQPHIHLLNRIMAVYDRDWIVLDPEIGIQVISDYIFSTLYESADGLDK